MESSENKTKYNQLMNLKEPEILEIWRQEQDKLKQKLIYIFISIKSNNRLNLIIIIST